MPAPRRYAALGMKVAILPTNENSRAKTQRRPLPPVPSFLLVGAQHLLPAWLSDTAIVTCLRSSLLQSLALEAGSLLPRANQPLILSRHNEIPKYILNSGPPSAPHVAESTFLPHEVQHKKASRLRWAEEFLRCQPEKRLVPKNMFP